MPQYSKYRRRRTFFNVLLIALCVFVCVTTVADVRRARREREVLDEARDAIIRDISKTHPGTWCVSVWRAESNNRNLTTFHGIAVDDEGYPYVYLVVKRDDGWHTVQMFYY